MAEATDAATEAATEWSGSTVGGMNSRSTSTLFSRIGIVAPAVSTSTSSGVPPVSITTSHDSAYSAGGRVTVASPSALK